MRRPGGQATVVAPALELELGGGLELLEMRLELLCAVELPDDIALELLARTLELLDRPELLDRGGVDELELGTVLPDVKLELLGAVETIELLELGSTRVTEPLPDQPDEEDDGSESMCAPVACMTTARRSTFTIRRLAHDPAAPLSIATSRS